MSGDPFENPPAFPMPAFESQGNTWGHPPQEGMTLRDWFAGQALIGIVLAQVGPASHGEVAYSIADDMMAARAKDVSPQDSDTSERDKG